MSTLVDILRRRAREQPDRLAYVFLADGEEEEARLTYAELDARARAVAALLQELGIDRHDAGGRALLLFPTGPDYVAAFYGCLYAGVTAVPAYPPRPNRPMPRIQAIAADARAGVALTTSAILAGVERRVADLPDLQALAWRATDVLDAGAGDAWREPRISGDTLAFLQYTSGSTASPKGVMVSHANLLHNEVLIRDACGHGEDTPCVSWLPLYHDLGLIGNMIQSLYVGTPCTLMAPVAFLQSPIRWLRAVSRYRAHTSGGPNFAYDLCARKITPEQCEGLDLSSWRVAFNGAEPVRAETLERFARTFEPYGFRREALFPCYGLAETTLIVSAGGITAPPVVERFAAAELARHRAVPLPDGDVRELVGCGRVLGDLDVAIVEPESLVRRAEGEVGEIWVAGGSVARGYWDRPDVTAETFDARTSAGAGPYLRTGDLGFLRGGELYITGRIKDLIIIRGSNHYPQDLERTVELSHPALMPGASAAFSIDVAQGGGNEERLVVVQEIRRDQRRANVEEIAAAARAALAAEHELQLHALVLIRPGTLPKTSSGKVQRRRTRQDFLEGGLSVVGEWRESGRSDETVGGEEPGDLRSWLLARLGVQGEADLSGPVAALGLDSLRAIELSHEIEERTGAAFSLESFFGGLTVGELVDGIVNRGEVASPSSTERISAGEGDGAFELSEGQRALWFLWRLEPASPAYNIASAVRVRGPVDASALHRAFQRLVERHPALRATFSTEAGDPVQRVQPDARLSFVWEDATEWSESELREHLAREAWRPFDLETGPLLRVTLLGRPAGESVLLLSVHHIVSDMWSLAVLVRELGVLYAAATAPAGGAAAPALPALEVTYGDWARWQRQMLNGIDGERLRQYWEKKLAGELPALDMPTDRPRPPVQTDRGAAEAFRLSPELSESVRELGRRAQTTSFMTLLAGYQALLHRWTGQTDLIVGAPTSGRGRAQLSGLVGYFVNPVALRSDLAGEFSFSSFLDDTRQTVLGAFEHADYPFPTLVERLAPVRDPSRSPIFQAMFALQNAPAVDGQDLTAFAVGEEGVALEVGGLRLEHLPLPQRIAQFDLTLSIGEVAGVFAATLDYNADLFDTATARRLAAGFETLLAAAAADPDRRIADLPLLPEADRRQVLLEWNATAAPFREDVPVSDLFRRQAEATPGEPAVVYGDLEVTYAELARRASELAGRLRALGAAPDTLIGLCAERSPELVVGILGILESGAGYAPLDPEAPAERLASLLDRAGISILVTQDGLGLPWPAHLQLVSLDSVAPTSEQIRWAVSPESPATLLYTSGSTGEPKGVLLTHRNLANLVASFQASYAPGPGDAILPLTSVASASFVGEVLPALCSGAAVVLPDKGELLDFERTVDLIARRGISILSTVPSLVAGLNAIHERVPKLRLLLSGGEALSAGDVDRLLGTAEIVNGYGLTETTICSTIYRLTPADFSSGRPIPIGTPIFNHRLYVLDGGLEPLPVGCAGELFVAGEGLAQGYFRDPAATASRFLPDPFAGTPGERMYRTGDLARWLAEGSLEYLGRLDQQVKIRGFRVELGEIEAVLSRHPRVRECAVVARNEDGETRLAAYVVGDAPAGELLSFLRERLPEAMIPAAFVSLDALPLNANGKVDQKALPAPERLRPELEAAYVAPRGEVERTVAAVWRELLGIDTVGVHDNFFDLGGHSLLMARVHARLKEALGPQGDALSLIDLFRHPTVASLARFVAPDEADEKPLPAVRRRAAAGGEGHDIAVIAVSGRFPGARDVEQLWRNLVEGVESISRFTDEELLAAGNDPELVANPNYVKAKGILGGVDLFDAAFFGHSPRSAELTDPQHRVFLECAWEALELAGYDADRYAGAIGVFAGQSMNTYWLNNLYYHIDLVASLDSLAAAIGNDKDSLTTEVSYRMNLRGPSVLVQSSSSTSLTAVHYACQSLRAGECDMALAGGVSIHLPEVSGYLYHEGGTTDPEGHCRTFDAEAKGFVSGHGAGVVVLKRLPEAIANGDRVLAVIKGSACNNDGAVKVSYMAPSVDGHAEVVAMAQADAGVTPDTITYLEAHGTGTLLGDPIEVAALTQAFRQGTDRRGFCALGSIKTNIGHLDTAAGVVGLIKTVLCLERRTLPSILHFRTPNPKIDFASSPFFVNDRLREWESEGIPRRAGVSSLGMGGTNTHMVLEEAPALEPSGPSRDAQLLLLSARTATALDTLTRDLAAHLRQNPGLPLADAAYTLHTGRKVMAHRRAVVCTDLEEAVEALESRDPERVTDGFREAGARPVAFLFSGQGSQYAGMARGLYESEAVFREEVDRCAELLRPHLGVDLRDVILAKDEEQAAARLRQTALTQPALFVIEHALARLWMSWGVRPQAMLGHSIGEYAAACLAGVLSLEDALALVAERGRLMQSMPAGSMLAVPLPEPEVAPFLSAEISLAAVNRPDVCVLSGTTEAIEALERELEGRGIEARRLHTSHAFHSAMMDPILPAFEAAVRKVTLRAPRLPYLSNVTGTWITAAEATDPGYWVRQLRGTVRFAAGVGELLADPDRVLLEVGPGNALATAARQHPARRPEQAVAVSMRHPKEPKDDLEVLLAAVGRLWLGGVEVEGDAFWAGQRRLRVPLPTYPFERKRFWVDPKKPSFDKGAKSSADLADWFYTPVWKQSPVPFARDKVRELGFARGERWLVLLDSQGQQGLGERLLQRLGRAGADVIAVRAGAGTEDPTGVHLQVDPGNDEETTRFFANLREQGWMPSRILYLWALDSNGPNPRSMDLCLHGLMAVARGLGRPLGEPEDGSEPAMFLALTSGAQNISGEETPAMERAVLTGACKAIPREYSNLYCRSLDIPWPAALKPELQLDLVERILAEALTAPGDPAATVVGLRGPHRWMQAFEPVRLEEGTGTPRLKEGGIYLITGGLGGIGLTVAEHLARRYKAKLMLSGRTPLPPRPEWEGYLATCAPDDRVGRRLRKLLELKALGAEVMVVTGDAADPQNLRTIRDRAMARFGRIDGIFHAAGLPGGGLIHTRDRQAALSILGPKIDGTMAVMETFNDVQPQFLVLFSSVTSVLSQPGQADYAAGNAFLDAFAQAVMGGPVFTVSINWDAWQEVGMAVETEVPAELRAWREESLRQGVSPAQGIEALERILRASLPQVAVSRSDFQTRIEESHAWKALQSLEAVEDEAREVHARPALGSVYVAPRDETERRIAEIWQEVLGIDRVGIHDNFFDLGGNSLVGLKVVSRLKRELAAEVSAVTLFEGPTVASLAQLLGGAGNEGEDGEPAYADRKSRGALRREKLRRRKS